MVAARGPNESREFGDAGDWFPMSVFYFAKLSRLLHLAVNFDIIAGVFKVLRAFERKGQHESADILRGHSSGGFDLSCGYGGFHREGQYVRKDMAGQLRADGTDCLDLAK